MLTEAFTRHAEAVVQAFDQRLPVAPDRDTATEAVITLVTDDLLGSQHDLVLTVDLYLAAARNAALRAVPGRGWSAAAKR